MCSDVDIVVLTARTARYLADDGWVAGAVGPDAELVRTEEWGPLTERRVRLASGMEVEFGFVEPSWAATDAPGVDAQPSCAALAPAAAPRSRKYTA